MKEVTANQLTINTNFNLADKGRAIGDAWSRLRQINRRESNAVLSDARYQLVTAVCFSATDRKITRPQEAKPQAGPHHPLQRMSSQPSAFGQSMWKPWEGKE